MANRTALFQNHQQAGGKLVDFAGWDMPLHYGSQIEEHLQVRNDAGMFDVSHMTIIDLSGSEATAYLRYLLANDVAKLTNPGKALYSCMLNGQGGVVDDLIVYRLGEQQYRLVVNASTREKDIAWVEHHAKEFSVQVTPRADLAIIAVQGPQAIHKIVQVYPPDAYALIQSMAHFAVIEYQTHCIAHTGYTGEDGLEIMLPAASAAEFWEQLLAAGIKPCGLGARDTLRLEAGLNLYGSDMDETTSPLESNLGWTIAWNPADRNFIGRAALEAQKDQIKWRLVGLVLEQKGVMRSHQKVIIPQLDCGTQTIEGEITSGSFSPTLQRAIALARIPNIEAQHCWVQIRDQRAPARIVKPRFLILRDKP